MTDRPAEQKIWPKNPSETFSSPETADLKLENENLLDQKQTEEKSIPERNPHQISNTASKIRPSLPLSTKDPVMIKIEKIMEDGLNDSFQRLSPVAKQEFKLKGEQTASKIRDLLKSSHIKVKKILRLILDWLRMLPGINHFFLEQEAKIKTDKIIALKKY